MPGPRCSARLLRGERPADETRARPGEASIVLRRGFGAFAGVYGVEGFGVLVPLVLALVSGAPDPCSLIQTQDIARVLGWVVAPGTVRAYRLAGGAGALCAFEGREGTVIVTVPSKGSGLPNNDLTSDLGAVRTPLHDVYGLGVPVEIGRGCALIHRRGRAYGITVQPIDAQFADENQMRSLASALVAHLPRGR